MKAVILSEAESFCKEHNFNAVGLETLRSMAVEDDSKGRDVAFREGFSRCHDAVIKAMNKAKPEDRT